MPRIDNVGAWALCSCRRMPWRSCLDSEEPISSRRPWPRPPCLSRPRAFSTARSARWPGSGMIDGRRASNRLRLVARSSDSGTKVWALPAYTMMAVCASVRACSKSYSLRRACSRRLGGLSVASISGVSSSSTTKGSEGFWLACSTRCQLGPNSASTANSQAMPSTTHGDLLSRPLPPLSNSAWNAGGRIICQRPARFCRCHNCHSNQPSRGSNNSHQGCNQCGHSAIIDASANAGAADAGAIQGVAAKKCPCSIAY